LFALFRTRIDWLRQLLQGNRSDDLRDRLFQTDERQIEPKNEVEAD
jgi:hypothetical protein